MSDGRLLLWKASVFVPFFLRNDKNTVKATKKLAFYAVV